MMRSRLPTGGFLLLLACSCGPSAGAMQVRMYASAEEAAGCASLGQVRGEASGWGEKFRADAEDDVRENVLKMGGNAFVVTSHESGFTGHHIMAKAYRCSGGEKPSAEVAAAPAGAQPAREPITLPKPTRVLVLELRSLDGDARTAKILTNMLTAELDKVGNLTLVDRSDIEAALDVERQKDLLGCDENSCLSEIAGALGTSLILHGSIGSLGSMFEISASLFDNQVGGSRARVSKTLARNDDALVAIVPELAAELAQRMAQAD